MIASAMIIWIVNSLILVIMLVVATMIGLHAHYRRSYPRPDALIWAFIALFTFPIGPLGYLFFVIRRN